VFSKHAENASDKLFESLRNLELRTVRMDMSGVPLLGFSEDARPLCTAALIVFFRDTSGNQMSNPGPDYVIN